MRIPRFARPAVLAPVTGLIALLALLVLGGCEAGADPAPASETARAAEAEPGGRTAPSAELPDTTAEAVWAYLQDASYADAWRMWPGKEPLYPGGEPHGMLLSTYLNDTAWEGLTAGSGPLPTGSIVVKENYRPDSTLAAVTVMYAHEGYDPAHDDWFWAKYLPDGQVEAAGRVAPCQECHQAGERGFLRTPYSP